MFSKQRWLYFKILFGKDRKELLNSNLTDFYTTWNKKRILLYITITNITIWAIDKYFIPYINLLIMRFYSNFYFWNFQAVYTYLKTIILYRYLDIFFIYYLRRSLWRSKLLIYAVTKYIKIQTNSFWVIKLRVGAY